MNNQAKPCMPDDPALAIAYVRWQHWGNLYEPEEGFSHGTIFKELDKPFYGRRARYGMQNCR